MKKLLTILLCISVFVSVCGCQSESEPKSSSSQVNNTSSVVKTPKSGSSSSLASVTVPYSSSSSLVNSHNDYTPTHYHYFSSPTCTQPGRCSCGATDGSPLGHDYSGGECRRCGAKDPSFVMPTITVPYLPETYSYYSYDNKVYTSCRISKITCTVDHITDEGVWYTFTFYGTSTYNYQGNGQSSAMKVGWKLYDSNNTVVKSGTMYSESVAVGESFAAEENIYYLKPGGKYHLDLLDVN